MSLSDLPLRSDRQRPAWFMLLKSDPVARAWTGVGNFAVPADSVDTIGGIYLGLGLIVKLPAVTIPLNGAMVRHEFVLAGVAQEVLRLANADRDSVRMAPIHIGLTMLGDDAQPIAPVCWLWEGTADTPKVSRGGQGGATRSVSLSVGTGEIQRKQRRLSRWTGIDQHVRSEDDTFCDRTVLYDLETTERWPN